MYKVSSILLCLSTLLFSIPPVLSQSLKLESNRLDYSHAGLDADFRQYAVMNMDIDQLSVFLSDAPDQFVWDLDYKGQRFKIQLTQNNLIDQDYFVQELGNETKVRYGTSIKTYEGITQNVGGGGSAFTFDDNFISGFFEYGESSLYIEPLRWHLPDAADDEFLLYDALDIINNNEHTCGHPDHHQSLHESQEAEVSNIETRNAGNCFVMRNAIASDVSMFLSYGSTQAVEQHNIAVLNASQFNFRHEFSDNIELTVVTQLIATNDGQQILTELTNSSLMLTEFQNWGETVGFGTEYDMALYWTNRNITDSNGNDNTVGFTYVPAFCGSNRYQVLEDFTESVAFKKVLLSHEYGHNFDANHPAATNTIMSGTLTLTDDWSLATINTIEGYIPSFFTCTPNCSETIVANFVGSGSAGCVGSTVSFKNYSPNSSTSNWSFPGGSPASSSISKPSIIYNTVGNFDVSLTTSHLQQTSQITKNGYVSIQPELNAPTCTANSNVGLGTAGVKFLKVANIISDTGTAREDGNKYLDFSCDLIATMEIGNAYEFLVEVGDASAQIFERIMVFIDFNEDGDFSDDGEQIVRSDQRWAGDAVINSQRDPNLLYTVPSNVPTNRILRMRVMASESINNSCSVPITGQMEDYGVVFTGASSLPVELVSFDAQLNDEVVDLDWTVSQEVNTDRYIIERSTDGQAYERIGEVEAIGNTYNLTTYDFTDEAPLSGLNYYRLYILDDNGTFEYSDVVTVRTDEGSSNFKIYPVPLSGSMLYAELIDQKAEDISVNIFDTTGRLVHGQRYSGEHIASSAQRLTIELPSIAPGIYLISLKGKSSEYRQKITIF